MHKWYDDIWQGDDILHLIYCNALQWFCVITVGGFNPFEKYARQIGSFPQVGVNIKNIWVATTQ